MPKMTLKQALKNIYDSYDAFYIENKYVDLGQGTHGEEEKLLEEALGDDPKAMKALMWIHARYDCYYKKEYVYEAGGYHPKSPFYYLKSKIEEKEESQ